MQFMMIQIEVAFYFQSSLLMAMLGEMPLKSGRINVNGEIAYVPQEAWIFSGTVQDNILFGCALNRENYNKSLLACALDMVSLFCVLIQLLDMINGTNYKNNWPTCRIPYHTQYH